MKKNTINYLILILLLSTTQTLLSQENKFNLTVEYSPNFSRLTNEVANEKFKLSHNALLRISYNTYGKIKPTIGLGFLNTGELESSQFDGQLGIESIKYIQDYNYIIIPFGFKYNLGKLYVLPEIGIGINISNKTKEITEFTNGDTEKETRDAELNSGEFSKSSIPVSISIGTNLELFGKSFSTGLKGYYGLNQIVKDVPRSNHYFGIGLILATNL